MNIKRYIIGVLAVAFSFVGATAQVDRSLAVIKSMLLGFEYEVYAGTNIGGASPLPLPAEIRESANRCHRYKVGGCAEEVGPLFGCAS